MRKRVRALLIPALLLAILLAGCRQNHPEVLTVPTPKHVVVTSTVFPQPTLEPHPGHNFMTDYQRWLQDSLTESRERAGQ